MLFTSKKGHEVTIKQRAISAQTVSYVNRSLAIIIITALRSVISFLTYRNYDFIVRCCA